MGECGRACHGFVILLCFLVVSVCLSVCLFVCLYLGSIVELVTPSTSMLHAGVLGPCRCLRSVCSSNLAACFNIALIQPSMHFKGVCLLGGSHPFNHSYRTVRDLNCLLFPGYRCEACTVDMASRPMSCCCTGRFVPGTVVVSCSLLPDLLGVKWREVIRTHVGLAPPCIAPGPFSKTVGRSAGPAT